MGKSYFAALLLVSSGLVAAQSVPTAADHSTMDHRIMAGAAREPGQSAYAAMGETVAILLADPATDWSKVDVDALRRHLVDMDNVTLHSRVVTTRLPNGARFAVGADGATVGSIQRMTRSHFAMADSKNGWSVKAANAADGATVTVTSAKPADAAKIAGLGFFGMMTMGEHHQPHHLMMARGAMRH